MPELSKNKILDLYNSGASPYEIAEELETYPNKIRRLLKSLGVELRGKSRAQSLALERGVREHPTAGKKRDDNVKLKISQRMTEAWSVISPEERERRAEQAKKQWESMSVEEREKLKSLAAKAIREAAKDGSKLEKFLLKALTASGFSVEFHREGLIPNEKLQLDLFIPKQNIAIEVDGPSHFFPIWGEESLKKHLRADTEKNGLLLKKGFHVIRIKCLSKTISQSKQRKLVENVLDVIDKIESATKSSLYEIEV